MSELVGKARQRVKNRIFNSDQFKDRWVLLLKDPDCGLHFVCCQVKRKGGGMNSVVVHSFPTQKAGRSAMDDPEVQEQWAGYAPTLIRYEALTAFPDHHRRHHWKYDTEVLFCGTEAQMSWVATLTVGKGMNYDGAKGLYIPGEASAVRPNN